MARTIQLAVASNFTAVMADIVRGFEKNTGDTVKIIPGSTGKLYAQISHGAPYDIFFAADVKRPQRLEEEGRIIAGSRFTYAIGKLVLWSPQAHYVDARGRVLAKKSFHHLAMANPVLAPYGRAAQQVLQALGKYKPLLPKIVQGENISQTFQFVKSGNAELGFVACSQIKRPGKRMHGSFWFVPQTLYAPIKQQAVLLKQSKTAQAFLSYMKTGTVLTLMHRYGYDAP